MSVDIGSSQIEMRRLLPEDKKDLFEWRNHPRTRSNSFTTTLITWESHEKWFKEKINSPNSVIYIAYGGDQKIGSVRFDRQENLTMVSVMLNPGFMGRKLAASVIRRGVDEFIKEKGAGQTIHAEIKKDNVASIKAFQRAGFMEHHVTYVFNPDSGNIHEKDHSNADQDRERQE